jgi:hypothetical protein
MKVFSCCCISAMQYSETMVFISELIFDNSTCSKLVSFKYLSRRENFFETFRIISLDMGAGMIEKECFKVVV